MKEDLLKPHEEYLLNLQQKTPSSDESLEPLNEQPDKLATNVTTEH